MRNPVVTGFRFLIGATGAVVIALTGDHLPDEPILVMRATTEEVVFKTGTGEPIGRFSYNNSIIFNELTRVSHIGGFVSQNGQPFPGVENAMIYVQTARAES